MKWLRENGQGKTEDWCESFIGQRRPKIARKPPEVGRDKEGFPVSFRRNMALLIP